MLTIRRAVTTDLDAIVEIYNEAILTTTATFDTEIKSVEEQRPWFVQHGSKNPIIVAVLDGVVVGWASLSNWSDRCAYADTAEISLYVREKERRKGFGRKLIETIVAEGEQAGFHTLIARIAEGNDTSVRLHSSVGFEQIGVMKEVGRKFGKLLDVLMMQKIYRS